MDVRAGARAGLARGVCVHLAFGYFVVKSIFRRHAAVAFFLLTAIFTSAVGVAALAFQYQTVEIHTGGTILMVAALGLAALLRRQKVHSFWPYLILCGPLAWWALFLDGLHPALALVPIVPFLPHAARRLELFTDAPHSVTILEVTSSTSGTTRYKAFCFCSAL